MKTSAVGLELIKRNEGCRLVAYQDIVGVWTIGYGDTLNVYAGKRITQAEAEEGLARRLANEFEPGVLRAIGSKVETSQNQFDAMVSLAWNIGVGSVSRGNGFSGSSVARKHSIGDFAGAQAAFAAWNKAGGRIVPALARRRGEEAALYGAKAKTIPAALAKADLVTNSSDPVDDLLKQGDSGSDVEDLQSALGVHADGDFGPATKEALQAFQQAHGLTADGVVGPKTRAALNL